MEVLRFLHERLAVALFLTALVLGIWGSVSFLRSRSVSGSFRSSYLLLAGLTAIQSLAGLALFAFHARPHDLLHIVYGIFAIVFLPGMYVYAAGRDRAREAAFLALACWIVLIAYGRAFMTGT